MNILSSVVDVLDLSAIFIIASAADVLLKYPENNVALVRGFIDNFAHGLIGLLSWHIVTLHSNQLCSKYEVILCGLLASIIDIDHFIKARSFRIVDAIYQQDRPFLHCSTIPLVIFIWTLYINTNVKYSYLSRFGWMLWTAFSSHHLRDAYRRGLWFYPLGSTTPLTHVSYMGLTLFLPYITAYLMNNLKYEPTSVRNMDNYYHIV